MANAVEFLRGGSRIEGCGESAKSALDNHEVSGETPYSATFVPKRR